MTLIDRHNYHQFQPLLYQVATSQLASSDIAFSLRKLFRDDDGVDVMLGDVASLDPEARTVTLDGGEAVPATPSSWPRDPSPTSSAPRAPRSTRSRSTRWTTPPACARASSGCSRRPSGIRG